LSANSWSGTVFDGSGKPVAGATLRLHASGGSKDCETTTSANGEFRFDAVEVGAYSVSVSYAGKIWSMAVAFSIPQGAPVRASLVLSAENQTLVLRADTGSQASGGEHLSSSEVSSLPLNERDFSKLLLLAAGTMTDTNGAATSPNSSRRMASANGLCFRDGRCGHERPRTRGATFSNFNVNAIQEVQSSSGVMPARSGTARPDLQTWSQSPDKFDSWQRVRISSQRLARRAEFLRSSKRRESATHPPFARNEFGTTIGGPVVLPHLYDGRDKTFSSRISGLPPGSRHDASHSVPTAAERKA